MVAYNLYATFLLVGISLMGAIGLWERSFTIEIIEKKKELVFLYVVSYLTRSIVYRRVSVWSIACVQSMYKIILLCIGCC